MHELQVAFTQQLRLIRSPATSPTQQSTLTAPPIAKIEFKEISYDLVHWNAWFRVHEAQLSALRCAGALKVKQGGDVNSSVTVTSAATVFTTNRCITCTRHRSPSRYHARGVEFEIFWGADGPVKHEVNPSSTAMRVVPRKGKAHRGLLHVEGGCL